MAKKVQIRLSERSYEDLVRIADGRPLQQYLERMIDEAIMAVEAGPATRRPARDVATPERVIEVSRAATVVPAPHARPVGSVALCAMCERAGPPKTRPCSKCGARAA